MSDHHTHIPFTTSNGNEYELEVEVSDWGRVASIERLVERIDGSGRTRIVSIPTMRTWDDLIEMTHDLRIVIVNWRSDGTN